MAAATFLSQVAQITPSLYLSGFVGASESTVMKHGITCIITVCKEVPKLSIPFVESIKLDVLDKPSEQLERYFDYVADKINEVATRKGASLVHCVAGISRSASMCIVYLMKYQNMPLKDAHELVKSKRHFIRPNLGFWKQLVDYERKLQGKNSIKLIHSAIGLIPDIYENEIKNMVWATPNGLVVTSSNSAPSNSQTQKSPYKQQSSGAVQQSKQQSSTAGMAPTTSAAVLNLNASTASPIVGVNNFATTNNRSGRAYYQTTYSTSYCAQKR